MLPSICHYLRSRYSRYRCGIDTADVQHVRADLRFRLAIVEYAYFGRSGRRVVRCIKELKELLGDKAVSRYLRSLDPDLRTQFVERFQGFQRDPGSRERTDSIAGGRLDDQRNPIQAAGEATLAPNVVPFTRAARQTNEPETPQSMADDSRSGHDTT